MAYKLLGNLYSNRQPKTSSGRTDNHLAELFLPMKTNPTGDQGELLNEKKKPNKIKMTNGYITLFITLDHACMENVM